MKTRQASARANRLRMLLPVLQFLCFAAAHSADGSPQFSQEILKQDKIYQSRGEQVPEGYLVDRSLLSYMHTLSPGFDRALANLGPKDRWLDIGAGRGQAILDYYAPRFDMMHVDARARRGGKAQAVAMSIEDRRTSAWQLAAAGLAKNQIQYWSGRRLREYSPEELGRYRLITDVTGGFSYTTDLSLFMETVLAVLEPGGSFYTLLTDVRSEAGTNRPFFAEASFLTEIKNRDGSDTGVCSWLKRIACVEVACELKADWRPPIEAFHIRRTCAAVAVPKLLPVYFEAGTPPGRGFQMMN